MRSVHGRESRLPDDMQYCICEALTSRTWQSAQKLLVLVGADSCHRRRSSLRGWGGYMSLAFYSSSGLKKPDRARAY